MTPTPASPKRSIPYPHPFPTTTPINDSLTPSSQHSPSPFPSSLPPDNHLGYNEKDPVRGNDSFAAFEEVMYLAKSQKCDLVLLSGDMFHDNKVSVQLLGKKNVLTT